VFSRVLASGARSARRRLIVVGLILALCWPVVIAGAATADDGLNRTVSGTFVVRGHGEGHGRGMSQYGALGAAMQGLGAAQILAFYYPGTARTAVNPDRPLRVWISRDDDSVTEVLRSPDLEVVDEGTGAVLPIPAEAEAVRTQVYGSGFVVHVWMNGAWWDINTGASLILTAGGPVRFRTAGGIVHLVMPNGDHVGYRDTLRAVRNGNNAQTINTLPLDDYVRGVVPRESPSYWLPAALQAQAIAARSYANGYRSPNSNYDICDTAACQVYMGAVKNGEPLETANTNAATSATRGVVLTYNGQPINAQFGSTNGGWTVDGGVPYLPAQRDPYEAIANPPQSYANWTGTLSAENLESRYPEIGRFLRIRITQRDGNGEWGGRVLGAVIEGTAGSRTLTGDQIRLSLTAPVRSAYFQIFDEEAGNLPEGAFDDAVVNGTVLSVRGWAFDPNEPATPLTVHVYDRAPSGAVRTSVFPADQSRPDVAAVYPTAGHLHGFTAQLPISGRGTHNICAYGINVGAGSINRTLGCRTATVGGPLGVLDWAFGGTGFVDFAGWTIDPAEPGRSVEVHLYATGPAGTVGYPGFIANQARPDVAAVFPFSGSAHGFTGRIHIARQGNHQICAYAIVTDGLAPNQLLGCRSVTV
jgi:SpoIID/LytB domain protein